VAERNVGQSMDITERTKDVRDEFRPIAQAYRRKKCFELLFMTPAFAISGAAMVFLAVPYSIIAAVCFFTLVAVAGWFAPKLVCLVCRMDAESRLDQFCPVCGARTIGEEERRKGALPTCPGCGKRLWRSKRGAGVALYSICFCTHCGSHLDDQGL